MKIILVNNCYPFGSTGIIVKTLEDYLIELGYSAVVLYGHGEKSDKTHKKIASNLYMKLQALRRRATGIMYGGCYFSTYKAIRIIKKNKPDIVHLHCLNGNFINIYNLITWLKKNNIPTVLTNHAEFMYTANCGHAFDCDKYQTGCGYCPRFRKETRSWFVDRTHKSWQRMKKAFDEFTSLTVTNVSPWLSDRAKTSSILKNFDNHTVLNGVETSVFNYKNNHHYNKMKTVLHVTANFSDSENDNKGGSWLIKLAKKFIGQDVIFIVVGKYSLDRVIPSNMKLLGNISDREQLACIYSSADVLLLTSKKETFSMVVAESLCCGTPVVGFMAGAPEQIAIPEYSEFVPYGDIEALYKATVNMLNRSIDKTVLSDIAKSKYSKEKMAEDYLKLYRECL